MSETVKLQATLLSSREIAPEINHFEFEVAGVEEFKFTPGQFISIVEQVNGEPVTRAYSIASPHEGNHFALCLNRVPDGLVSNHLFKLKSGDKIEISQPLGYFTLRHPGRRLVFIATGTGIAPFRSMLLHHLPRTQPHIRLLFGTRYEKGMLYRAELEELEQMYPTFRYLATLTRPSEQWEGRSGRVQAHLEEALALRSPDEIPEVDVYVCGLKEMVDEVRAELKKRGFDRKQIIYEKYD